MNNNDNYLAPNKFRAAEAPAPPRKPQSPTHEADPALRAAIARLEAEAADVDAALDKVRVLRELEKLSTQAEQLLSSTIGDHMPTVEVSDSEMKVLEQHRTATRQRTEHASAAEQQAAAEKTRFETIMSKLTSGDSTISKEDSTFALHYAGKLAGVV